MALSSSLDSRRGGGKRWQSTEIGSKTPTVKVIIVTPLTPLSSTLAGGGGLAAATAAEE
jgi:hypothetical protein